MTEFLDDEYRKRWPDLDKAKENDPSFNLKEHFVNRGCKEARHLLGDAIKWNVEQAFITNSGYVFLSGWIFDPYWRENNYDDPDYILSIDVGFFSYEVPKKLIFRYKRPDVNKGFEVEGNYDFGFTIFCKIDDEVPISNDAQLSLHRLYNSGEETSAIKLKLNINIYSESIVIKRYFKSLNAINERVDSGMGAWLNAYDRQHKEVILCWKNHLKNAKNHNVTEFTNRENDSDSKFTFITVLYGKTELLQPQLSLFFSQAMQRGGDIILVSNSPEMHKKIMDLCEYASRIYEGNITLVTMYENAGFSEANNIAVNYAKSDVIAFVNPDIFSCEKTNWDNFISYVKNINNTQIIAPYLHYSDGSVMHSGMDIHKDPIFLAKNTQEDFAKNQYDFMLRVDHPKKGHLEKSFSDYKNYNDKKIFPVEAVTGGFMLLKRSLFEAVGGFANDYIFGHFEDADFCLRAKEYGAEIYCAPDLRFIHLEGRGSKQQELAVSAGNNLFNRCHFTRQHEAAYRQDTELEQTVKKGD